MAQRVDPRVSKEVYELSSRIKFRPRTIAGNVWPPVTNSLSGPAWCAYQELCQTQWLAAEQVEANQLAQCRMLLEHCARNVPYYSGLLTGEGLAPADIQTMDDFRRIPVLTRAMYAEHFDQIHAGALPAETIATGESITSGTSGHPIKVLSTNVVGLLWQAFLLRDLDWCDIDPLGALAAIRVVHLPEDEAQRGLDGIVLPHWGRAANSVIHTGPSHLMSVTQRHDRQLEWLVRTNPNYILSYPSNLEHLASLAVEQGVRVPNLKCVQAISETLSDSGRRTIETGFGVPVKSTYSCVEAGYLASPCPDVPEMLHVHAENVLLEVVREDGRPCQPSEEGEVLVTTLHNFRGPFIRYRIGDTAVVGDRCSCGRGLPTIRGVQGKMRPLLRAPTGVMVHPSQLHDDVRLVGGFHQFQIVQKADESVHFVVARSRDWSEEKAEAIRRVARRYLTDQATIVIEPVERIPLPPGGKMLDVVTEF